MKPRLVPTDVPNPIDGGCLYVWAVPVPLWRRWLSFFRLAWMLWGADWDGRIAFATAMDVAWGLSKRKWQPVEHNELPEKD